MKTSSLRQLVLLGLAGLVAACGDDTGGGGGAGGGSTLRGQGEPCTDDAQCADGLTCDLAHEEATCEPPHGDVASSSSTSSGGEGGGEPASDCELLCTCLGETCAALEGYPYADGADCLASCEAHTAEEVTCWGTFCQQAATAADPAHACEHAWGDAGLDEC